MKLLQCKICKRLFHNLGHHLSLMYGKGGHNLTCDEYKKKYNIKLLQDEYMLKITRSAARKIGDYRIKNWTGKTWNEIYGEKISKQRKINLGNKMKKIFRSGFNPLLVDGAKEKQRISLSIAMSGKGNPMWRGGNVGYMGVHLWLYKQLGKASCCAIDSKHKSSMFEWANIDGSYERNIKKYLPLCAKCHRNYDRKYIDKVLVQKALKKWHENKIN